LEKEYKSKSGLNNALRFKKVGKLSHFLFPRKSFSSQGNLDRSIRRLYGKEEFEKQGKLSAEAYMELCKETLGEDQVKKFSGREDGNWRLKDKLLVKLGTKKWEELKAKNEHLGTPLKKE